MKDRTNDQPGAQRHAEGEYGDLTRERNRERIQEPFDVDETDDLNPPKAGRHRIHEDREQHDEADKNSEKNRLARERDKSSRDRSSAE